jgi:hypothetical protein
MNNVWKLKHNNQMEKGHLRNKLTQLTYENNNKNYQKRKIQIYKANNI